MSFLPTRASVASLIYWLAFFSATSGVAAIATPQVRVRVIDGEASLAVRGVDLALNSSRPGAKGFRLATERISEWRVECKSADQVEASLIKPVRTGLKPWIFREALTLESPSGFITVAGRRFRERVVVHPVRKANRWQCEGVNHVDIEKYLDGLVNSEFSARWKPEAIDSQVIAARTYAYFQMREARARGAHFDIESSVKDQVYEGARKEDFRSSLSALRTKGLILSRPHASTPIKAYYHSTCGGLSELPENVWGRRDPAFQRRVACSTCQGSPSFLWEANFSGKRIQQALLLQAESPTPEEKRWIDTWPKSWRTDLVTAQLESIQVVDQTPGGRAKTVRMIWRRGSGSIKFRPSVLASSGGDADQLKTSMSSSLAATMADLAKRERFEISLSASLFRIWSDPVVLKSTAFQVFASGADQFIVRGRGYGHGVGLCQWGAKGLAEKGADFRTILKHYYPDAVLSRAW